MIFVYSLGGSILAGRDAQSLQEYAQALKELDQVFTIHETRDDALAGLS
jgi:uridylate kinase